MIPAARPGGGGGWAGPGPQSSLCVLCPGWHCSSISLHLSREQHLPKALRAAGEAQITSTPGPAEHDSELPKSSEKHVLCLLALLQGAACAPHVGGPEAGQPPVPLGKVSQVSVMAAPPSPPSLPALVPMAAAASLSSLPPLCPASCPELRGRPKARRWPGGHGAGRGGHGSLVAPVPSPSPWPAHAGHLCPFLGLPTGICCG